MLVSDQREQPDQTSRPDSATDPSGSVVGRGRDPYRLAAGALCALHALVLLGLVESYSFFILSAGWQEVLTMLLLCLVLALRPNGLFAVKGIRT